MRSHYGDNPKHLKDREKIYATGNSIAEWLGFDSWFDIPVMQMPEHIDEFRRIITAAK